MPQDIIKNTGQLKSANATVGGGAGKNFPVVGIVKDNIDPTRAGRIKVLLTDKLPQNSDNADSWITVSYMSNFFGKIDGAAGSGKDDNGTYKSNSSSYGEWHAPPDIGTKVICIFINGDINFGFYIGCVPEAETLHMVPAIGSSDNIVANEGEANSYGGATRLPVTNFNTNNKSQVNSPTFNDSPRPVHSYTASIMNQQGIIRDPVRGPISSSASREAASRVGWGVSTPGRPIYEGGYDDASVVNNLDASKNQQLKVVARRGGHSIVMDDGDVIGRDQLIRIRTALGHQILMSDDGQTLMILHSNGQSYIELGKEGTVDVFSTNSFNVRTQGDINLHADRNINIHAMENLNIQAKNIQTNSEQTTKLRAGSDFNIAATGKITGLAGGAIAWGAGGDASLVGGGQAYVNGSKVNLNSGAPSTSPESISPIPLVAQTDTLFDQDKGFIAAPGKLLTIASRAPAHAPWANAGQGVDIKTSMNASDNLPANAPAATQVTNQAAQETNPSPPAVATVASAPANTPPVSESMNKNVTAAAVAATATDAAKGPLNKAVKAGTAIVETGEGKCAAVGPMAITPSQMELGGTLKPGASTLVTKLIQSGANISQAMPSSIFTTATTIEKFTQNVSAQTHTIVNTMKKAQTALGAVGAITGKESPTQIAGMVASAATVGVGPTIAALHQASATLNSAGSALSTLATSTDISQSFAAVTDIKKAFTGSTAAIGTSLTGSLSGALGGSISSIANSAIGAANNVAGATLENAAQMLGTANNALSKAKTALNVIGSGGAAAKLTESIGGLGGIQSALTAMGKVPNLSTLVNQTEGIAVSAFNAVKQSLKPFKANVPQNLTKIAKENAAATATVADTTGAQNTLGSIAKSATGALSTIAGGTKALVGVVQGAENAIGSVNNSIASITGATSTALKAASTISGIGSATTSTINNITSIVNTIPKAVTGSPLNTTLGGVDIAINSVNAIAGAASTITAGGGNPSLSNAAVVVQQGAQAAVSSALASGLSNLPGGINTVTNVVNNAIGAKNILPGVSSLTSAIKSASSSVMNGLNSAAGAASGLTNITGNLTGTVNGVPGNIIGKLNSLTSLASTGLSVGGIAQLQSAISSLTGGTPGSISLPAVGYNTTNRAAITAQIGNNLGDPGIPPPNLVGEITQQAKDSLEDIITKNKERLAAANEKFNALLTIAKNKKDNYIKQRDLQGENDPSTQQYYKEWKDLINSPEFAAAEKEYLAAFDANSAARDAKLSQDLATINNTRDANSFLALARKGP